VARDGATATLDGGFSQPSEPRARGGVGVEHGYCIPPVGCAWETCTVAVAQVTLAF
jgi:hypothetical protein